MNVTLIFQIYYGEKSSGITLHKIDNGSDTGPIIASVKYKIHRNTNAFQNYHKLMAYSVKLLKKILKQF